MKKRNQYTGGVLHKLKINQVAKQESFQIDELFIIKLNSALLKWFSLIVKTKLKSKRKPRILHCDLKLFSNQIKEILESERGYKL